MISTQMTNDPIYIFILPILDFPLLIILLLSFLDQYG